MQVLVLATVPDASIVQARLLAQHGIGADGSIHLDDALNGADLSGYEAVLIDVASMPGAAAPLLQRIRQKLADARTLVVTDGGPAHVRIATLDAGADDVLMRPFSIDELIARLRALLRRPTQRLNPTLRMAGVELDTTTCTMHVGERAVRLRRREAAVLAMLMRTRDGFTPRERLERAVFSADAPVTPNALEAAMSRLRRTLTEHDAPYSVRAVRGIGYALVPRQAVAPGPRGSSIPLPS